MKKNFNWLILGSAFLAMGMGMPSCPGQQAMQQQIDALQNSNLDLSKKVQMLTSQVQGMSADLGQIKQLLPQMTNVISGQKGALDRLENDIKAIQAAKATKSGGKKKK